jgi:hypothetical protein
MRQLAVALLLALWVCGDAAAQYNRRGAPAGGAQERSQPTPRDEVTTMSANDQARLQLSNTRITLKLTPEQAPAWQVYENKVVDLLDDLARGINAPQGSALKQIDARIDVVRNRLTALEEIADAAAKLYGVLTEEQKGTADRMLAATLPTLYSGAPLRPDPSRTRR